MASLAPGIEVDYNPVGDWWTPARVESVAAATDGADAADATAVGLADDSHSPVIVWLRFSVGTALVSHRLDLRGGGAWRRLAPAGMRSCPLMDRQPVDVLHRLPATGVLGPSEQWQKAEVVTDPAASVPALAASGIHRSHGGTQRVVLRITSSGDKVLGVTYPSAPTLPPPPSPLTTAARDIIFASPSALAPSNTFAHWVPTAADIDETPPHPPPPQSLSLHRRAYALFATSVETTARLQLGGRDAVTDFDLLDILPPPRHARRRCRGGRTSEQVLAAALVREHAARAAAASAAAGLAERGLTAADEDAASVVAGGTTGVADASATSPRSALLAGGGGGGSATVSPSQSAVATIDDAASVSSGFHPQRGSASAEPSPLLLPTGGGDGSGSGGLALTAHSAGAATAAQAWTLADSAMGSGSGSSGGGVITAEGASPTASSAPAYRKGSGRSTAEGHTGVSVFGSSSASVISGDAASAVGSSSSVASGSPDYLVHARPLTYVLQQQRARLANGTSKAGAAGGAVPRAATAPSRATAATARAAAAGTVHAVVDGDLMAAASGTDESIDARHRREIRAASAKPAQLWYLGRVKWEATPAGGGGTPAGGGKGTAAAGAASDAGALRPYIYWFEPALTTAALASPASGAALASPRVALALCKAPLSDIVSIAPAGTYTIPMVPHQRVECRRLGGMWTIGDVVHADRFFLHVLVSRVPRGLDLNAVKPRDVATFGKGAAPLRVASAPLPAATAGVKAPAASSEPTSTRSQLVARGYHPLEALLLAGQLPPATEDDAAAAVFDTLHPPSPSPSATSPHAMSPMAGSGTAAALNGHTIDDILDAVVGPDGHPAGVVEPPAVPPPPTADDVSRAARLARVMKAAGATPAGVAPSSSPGDGAAAPVAAPRSSSFAHNPADRKSLRFDASPKPPGAPAGGAGSGMAVPTSSGGASLPPLRIGGTTSFAADSTPAAPQSAPAALALREKRSLMALHTAGIRTPGGIAASGASGGGVVAAGGEKPAIEVIPHTQWKYLVARVGHYCRADGAAGGGGSGAGSASMAFAAASTRTISFSLFDLPLGRAYAASSFSAGGGGGSGMSAVAAAADSTLRGVESGSIALPQGAKERLRKKSVVDGLWGAPGGGGGR